jgi:hypothetical protein
VSSRPTEKQVLRQVKARAQATKDQYLREDATDDGPFQMSFSPPGRDAQGGGGAANEYKVVMYSQRHRGQALTRPQPVQRRKDENAGG